MSPTPPSSRRRRRFRRLTITSAVVGGLAVLVAEVRRRAMDRNEAAFRARYDT